MHQFRLGGRTASRNLSKQVCVAQACGKRCRRPGAIATRKVLPPSWSGGPDTGPVGEYGRSPRGRVSGPPALGHQFRRCRACHEFLSYPMLESSDKTFSEDLRRAGRRAVLVFWAPWARQCKDVSRFCRAAGQIAGDEAIIALNTDTNPVTAHAYHIQRVPTVKIITDGSVVWTTEGLPETEDLQNALQAASSPARVA